MEYAREPFDGVIPLEQIQALGKQRPPSEMAEQEAAATQSQQQTQDAQLKNGMTMTGEVADKVVINPDIEPLKESTEKHGVFTFGRFNPPTVGHEKLIHATEKVAKDHGVGAHIIASHSEGTSKNPVPVKAKVGYLKKVAAKTSTVSHSDKEAPSLLGQAAKLHAQGVTHLHMVAGSDRVDEYHKLLHKYNGTHEGALYNFKKITVHSAGHRDPDAEGTEGMSGTKMRALAHAGKHEEFKAGLPKALHSKAKEIGDHIRAIKEGFVEDILDYLEEAATVKTRLKRATNMRKNKNKLTRAREVARKRFAKQTALRRRALKKARSAIRRKIAGKRGAEYAKLSMSGKIALDKMTDKRKKAIINIAKRLGPRVKSDELKRLASVMSGKKFSSSSMPVVAEDMDIKQIITEKAVKALKTKADKSGVSLSTLQQVFARGMAAFKNTNPPNVTPQQWAFARVNSYLAKGKAFKADKDLREQGREEVLQTNMKIARNMKGVDLKNIIQQHTPSGHKAIEKDIRDDDEQTKSRKKADVIRRRTNQLKDKILEHAALDESAKIEKPSAMERINARFKDLSND